MAILIKPSVDPASRWVSLLETYAPGEEVRVWPEVGEVEDIEFAIVRRPPPGALAGCPNLRWVASIPAGVEPLLELEVVPPSVPIIRCVSANRAREMGEYVLLQALRLHRCIPEYEAMRARGEWGRLEQVPTASRRAGVMGLGELGATVAQTLAGAGFDTAAWTRTSRAMTGPLAAVKGFYGPNGLGPFLARTDILVCVLPLTSETSGILNAACFDALPQGAAIINVSRGAHLVEPDLIEALERGQLRGACLDVVSVEPPPPDLAVLHHPDIYVTPHIACRSRAEDLLPGLLDNMQRAREGRALLNEVERERGY